MKQVNAMGDACPTPVIKTKKALNELSSGQLEILVDNEIAVQNVQKFVQSQGCTFDSQSIEGGYKITVHKPSFGGDAMPSTEAHAPVPTPNKRNTVVIISSDTMGSGDDALGKILMKGFIYALTQLDVLPDAVLLYNAGAKLSIAGSESLKDLIALNEAGVNILTCGTCLNHFNIADQLGVGEVTNMYTILETMQQADHILRP